MAIQASERLLDLPHKRRACGQCSLVDLCLPRGLLRSEIERLEGIVQSIGPLRVGEHLYRIHDPFHAIYAVRSGYLKTYLVDALGRQQVLGFHLPGELIGLDAIYPDQHQCNAVSLGTTTVCKLPYTEITSLATQAPGLQKQLLRLMSKDIGGCHALGADYTAEERMASFLVSLSDRLQWCGYSATEFILAMTRRDIANYLRLAAETVSRVLTRFQDDDLIAIEYRHVRILQPAKLSSLCRHGLQFDRRETIARQASDTSRPRR